MRSQRVWAQIFVPLLPPRKLLGKLSSLGMLFAAAVHAASAKDLEEDVVVAGVIVAVAVVATTTTTPACLEVAIQDGCDVEAEAKMGTIKPGGNRGRSP